MALENFVLAMTDIRSCNMECCMAAGVASLVATVDASVTAESYLRKTATVG